MLNVPRRMNTSNKQINRQCRSFQDKQNSTYIKCVSEAVETVHAITARADKQAGVKLPSGKHLWVNTTEDVVALVYVMHQEDVFGGDRTLKGLPSFQVNPINK